MQERIIEIIVYVISELKQNKQISDININILEDRGYTHAEISTALSWLVDRLEFSERFDAPEGFGTNRSYRVFHPAESDMFTVEARGELVQMMSLGILDNAAVEQLMERIMLTGPVPADRKQLIEYVAATVFAEGNSNFPAYRVLLGGSDSVN